MIDSTANFVDENELSFLTDDIMSINDNILTIFDKIDSKILLLDDCVDGSTRDSFRNMYENIRKNYSIIRDNINSYTDDYASLVLNMADIDKYLYNKFTELTSETQKKADEIELL